MMKNFASAEENLGRVAVVAMAAFAITIFLTFALNEAGYNSDLAMLVIFGVMPAVAWYMSKAAESLGKNRYIYGIVSLIPPIAFLSYLKLRQEILITKLDRW